MSADSFFHLFFEFLKGSKARAFYGLCAVISFLIFSHNGLTDSGLYAASAAVYLGVSVLTGPVVWLYKKITAEMLSKRFQRALKDRIPTLPTKSQAILVAIVGAKTSRYTIVGSDVETYDAINTLHDCGFIEIVSRFPGASGAVLFELKLSKDFLKIPPKEIFTALKM